ncbi:MAG: PAS domain S-box protein, partial [Geobacteraceae bacterium]
MNLLECAGDSIFVINASNGRLEEMNSKGGELFGYNREEMGKLDGKDLIPLHEQSLYTALVRRIVRHGAAGEECITFRRKDGSHFLGEVNAMLIDLGDEKVVQAIVRDITQKKQAEQDILWRNRKLSILNSIIARANQSLNFHTVLDMALHETMDLFGAEGGAIHLLEKDGLALVTQRNFSVPFIALVGADDPALENPCRMAANRLCIALLDEAGPCCTMAVSARDSGWRNIAGIPLFAGKRLIGVMHILARAGMEYVPDDITFFTTMGNQIGICIEHARMFGELNWKSEELLRSHRLLEKNSRQLELARKRLEKNLARVELANQELERLDLMKNHFIGMVSHEFRTPLTSLLGSAEFLLANHAKAKDDDIQQLLEIIHTSGARLNEIITNLLKVARVEGNAPSIAKTTLWLQEVLDPVREEYETVLKERGQRLILQEGMETLPFICGHRGYLEEIFTQLLANAVKFTPDGGEICVAARVTDRNMLADKEQLLFRFNQR